MKKLLLALALTSGMAAAQPATHPLDPLTATELETVIATLTTAGHYQPGILFPLVELHDPPKAEVLKWHAGEPFRREAFAVLLNRPKNLVYEAVVDVKSGKELSYKKLEGIQPGILTEEYNYPAKLIRSDPRFVAALLKRGIADPENVQIDTWAAGLLTPEQHASGHRFIRCFCNYRTKGAANPYFRPLEVSVLFDLTEDKVVEVFEGVVAPLAAQAPNGELDEKSVAQVTGGLRPKSAALFCAQPAGGGFTLNGHEVVWEKWHFHYTMHPREGIVLQDVRYQDGNRLRPVMYRAALCEMVVPYGDPNPNWNVRSTFDLGEYRVGRLADSLSLGLDVPTYATLQNVTFADDLGKPYVQPSAVAIYERDTGVLWKHYDFDTQRNETRRARSLYLTYITTVGNYDYALSWVFNQDGSLGLETQLTGILLPKGTTQAKSQGPASLETGQGTLPVGEDKYGRLVSRFTGAPNHQHFFNFRLDLDVDGPANSLVELDNHSAPSGPENPVENGFIREVKPLRNESEAQRDLDPKTARSWMVVNPHAVNNLGQSTGYQLVAGENAVPYLGENSPTRKRAYFINHHIFGTHYREGEMNAAGFYPNQSTQDSGLLRWTADNESLVDNDLVLWYTFGITHNPRPEEWPIMSSHKAGFMLIPNGFFDRNPALDVPVPPLP